MCNHLVFRHYPITCHFHKIKTLGSTEPAGIVGGELFGSVTVKPKTCFRCNAEACLVNFYDLLILFDFEGARSITYIYYKIIICK